MKLKLTRSLMSAAVAAVVVLGSASGVQAKGDESSRPVTLTAQQETCMAGAKSTAKGMTGAARKANIKSAAQACGVWKRFSKLSADQQACLAANGLKRPVGRPTQAQRKQLRALAAGCGVTLKVKG